MSFVFRGTRTDIENAFPGIIPERRVRIHAARPVNTNSLAFLVTVLLLFMILNSHQMSPNFLLWLVFGFFLMATSLRMYATCQQLQAQAQAHAVAASGLLRHTELRLHMPPSIAFASRGRLQGLRLQLALLDREFDDLDYETLRALDADNVPSVPSMSDEEINALPVHKYKVGSSQSDLAATQQASSSSVQKQQDISIDVGNSKGSCEDELTCSVCLEQVNVGELIRSLPCLHQATKSLFSAPLSHLIGVRTIDNENHRSRQNLGLTASTDILGPVCHVRTLEDLSFPACHPPPLKRKSKYHASCIDPWLRQQGTCPVCKFKVGGGWHEDAQDGVDASYMV